MDRRHGSPVNNFLFCKSKAIPAALAVFGLFATVLYTSGTMSALIVDNPEGVSLGLMLPLVIFELALGSYLALFGMRREIR